MSINLRKTTKRLRVHSRALKLGFCLAVFAPALVAFGQSPTPFFVATTPYVLSAAIAPPAGDKITSFDISWVDAVRHKYYFANRTSKAVIVVDTQTNTVVGNYKPGFKGFAGNNNTAGPDGVLTTENELWVGDAPSQVWVLDPNTGTPVMSPISTGTTANRADEMCYDPTNKIVAVVNNADTPPFITFISTTTHTVLGQVAFDGVAGRPLATNGAEQCQWNPRDGKIYLSLPEVNGAGDNSSPGAVVVFDSLSRNILRTMSIPLASCTGPQGLAIGPSPQIGLGCNSGVISGSPASNTAIINETTGATIASFPGIGGGDEIWYDPGNNKYFLANRSQPGGEALFIIDAATFVVQRRSTGTLSNAHSVAVDPLTNAAYVPTSSAATSGLCSSKGAVDANGCILVYTPQTQVSAATHDFNGDGKSDILWRNTNSDLAIWLMNGTVISSGVDTGGVPLAWTVVGQRDFNGDTKSDILWRNTNGDVAIWLMNGTAASSALDIGNVPTSWTVVGTGDFNADGNGDILWRNTNGDLAIWLMNGTTVLSAVDLGIVPTSWTVVGTGDFNGDGKTDILWSNSNGDLAIWLMNGTTVSSAVDLGLVPTSWSVVGTGDFNGDGKADILWRNTNGDLAIWLMNGTAVSSAVDLGAVPTSWTVAETGDFNGDTKSDILWRNTNGDVAIWLMNGTAVSSAVDLGAVPTSWAIQGSNAD
jgi:FG-GAP-like repeat